MKSYAIAAHKRADCRLKVIWWRPCLLFCQWLWTTRYILHSSSLTVVAHVDYVVLLTSGANYTGHSLGYCAALLYYPRCWVTCQRCDLCMFCPNSAIPAVERKAGAVQAAFLMTLSSNSYCCFCKPYGVSNGRLWPCRYRCWQPMPSASCHWCNDCVQYDHMGVTLYRRTRWTDSCDPAWLPSPRRGVLAGMAVTVEALLC